MARGRRSNRTHGKSQNDSLRDALSGIGGEKDVLATGMMGFANYVTNNFPMLQRMYRSNIWVKKAVSIPARYAVKGWRKLEDESFEKIEKRLNLKYHTSEALKWANLFGGSMAVFIVDDGLPPEEPLDLTKLKEGSFKRVVIVDRWKTSFNSIETNPLNDGFGNPESYLINIQGQQARYHASRCHRFITDTLPYEEAVREQYWGVSVIEIIYRQLINDDVFLSSMANMMKRSTMDIFGIPGLANMIKSGNEEAVKERVRISQSTMSHLNAWVKDAGMNGQNAETYERITQQFTGFDAMDIQSLARLAAAADIPATIFLGKSPDGMNATGNSDLSIFSDRISTIREIEVDPFLTKCDIIMGAELNKEIPEYTWINPFPKSEKDEADIRTANMGVIEKMALMELPDSILAKQMSTWGIIEPEDVDEVIKGFDLEPFDIESEEYTEQEPTLEPYNEEIVNIDPSSSLNGAQVTALLDVISKIKIGEIKKATAIKIISTAFPLSENEAASLLQEVVEGVEEESQQEI